MSRILAVGTQTPPHCYPQHQVRQFTYEHFSPVFPNIERILPVFDHAEIRQRYFCMPMEWYAQEHGFAEKNKHYIEQATALGSKAVQNCLQKAGIAPEAIDHIFFVSTTGISTPSIDARIVNETGLPSHILRSPLWGLGCSGGVAGLIRACDYVKAYPDRLALLVSVELCSLTFLAGDFSKSNLVATALFGDGAAAVLVAGDQAAERILKGPLQGSLSKHFPKGLAMADSISVFWPDSLDVMGWDVTDRGLRVIFSRDIPTIVHKQVLPGVEAFLTKNTLQIQDIGYLIPHPGGAKVVTAYQEILQTSAELFEDARQVLGNCGNMSSCTVLYVLQRFLEGQAVPPLKQPYGLMMALGPGFCTEMALVTSQ